ncbi:MAG: hypothetical protein WCS65_13570 [Verrucomicrobiae bacterium]
MSDIGGTCERLRELEEDDSGVLSDPEEECATWLASAADALTQASLLAQSSADGKAGAK